MFGMSKRAAKKGAFWNWLADNSARIRTGLGQDSAPFADEIGEQFKKDFPNLVYEICVSANDPWTFCVSANGDPALFAQVEKAVQEAPTIEGWKVAAFRPRGSLDAEITMDGHKIGYDDIWCEAQMVEGKANVVLHIRGATVENEEALSHASLILMDNAVGEYDATTRLVVRDIAMLKEPPMATDQFFSLRDLPAFLDRQDNSSA
jgi:hypothetical protein